MDSILTSVKKLLGIEADYDEFDAEILMHINSVLMILTQLGVGPAEGFGISDDSAIWEDFITDMQKFEAVKTYVFLRVKLLFDSTSLPAAVIESYNRSIAELEWRLNVNAEST